LSRALELGGAKTSDFSCSPELTDHTLTVVFSGTGDVAVVEILGDYLKRLHVEASKLDVNQVVCDFRRLLFMNSSCFKAFVVWIDTVKNAQRPYGIRFLTDPDMHWQRRSLEALRRLATSVVTIEPVSAAADSR
jgi:hypothetical protein